MKQYWVLVKTSDTGGYTRAVVSADNPYAATQLAKAMYGKQLLSEFASPC